MKLHGQQCQRNKIKYALAFQSFAMSNFNCICFRTICPFSRRIVSVATKRNGLQFGLSFHAQKQYDAIVVCKFARFHDNNKHGSVPDKIPWIFRDIQWGPITKKIGMPLGAT